jgi:hypothetical protein
MTDRKTVPFQLPYMRNHGMRLHRLGYVIIPTRPGTKIPSENGWQTLKATSDDDIEGWERRRPNDGIGIRTGKTPAIDVDVKDTEFVDEYVREIEFKLGFAPRRIGNAPKCLMVYRTDAPFSKITSAEYIDSKGEKAQIEILGKGRMFIAYGVHPETRKDYEWPE